MKRRLGWLAAALAFVAFGAGSLFGGCYETDHVPRRPRPPAEAGDGGPPAELATSSASASAPALAPSSAPDAGCPAPPDDSLDNPWCAPAKEPAPYGSFRAKPEEVLAAIAKMKHRPPGGWLAAMVGPGGWLSVMLEDCMQRIGSPYVRVMRGVMSGETPSANVFITGSVEWNGRRYITLRNQERDHMAFFQTTDAVELTPRGPVQVIENCQDHPDATQGLAAPPDWSKFPEEVRERLCP